MMHTSYRPIRALIDLSALKHNLSVVKMLAPQSKVLAMIKANGYGHGMKRVAEQLTAADGFGVASIDEAIILRQKGFLHRIVLLEGLFSQTELAIAVQHRLDFVIHSYYQLEWLLQAKLDTQITVWVKLDTGMHRLGFAESELTEVFNALEPLKAKVNLHIMTHFASADELDAGMTTQQIERFNAIVETHQLAEFPQSLANSAAIQKYVVTHLNWVRPGIMLYGAGNCLPENSIHKLKPVMTLRSQITALRWMCAGDTVGYGGRWQASRDSLIGVIAVGYGDGYPRHAPDGTPVLINGTRVPLVGRVSMDMITVDLTDMADSVQLNDEAILWGQGLPVDEVAEFVGTIGYELLCQVTARVPKIEVRAHPSES